MDMIMKKTKRKTPSRTDQGLDEVGKEAYNEMFLSFIIARLPSSVKRGGEFYAKKNEKASIPEPSRSL